MLEDLQWLMWLAAALLLGIIEIFTVDLIFAMLAVGALGGSVAAALGAPWWLSAVVAVICSMLMFFFVRPHVLRRLRAMPEVTRTNVDRMIGETGTVIEAVTAATGLVRLPGGEWTARTTAVGSIPIGAAVFVDRIDGATAMVLQVASAAPTAPMGQPIGLHKDPTTPA